MFLLVSSVSVKDDPKWVPSCVCMAQCLEDAPLWKSSYHRVHYWQIILSLQHMSVQNGGIDVRQSDAIDGSKRNV